ncbi:MAG: DMT family transporter [Marinilabiliaceae bacterium]|nr:DMT family transporter [Marinilabiliaceae bacterium]
MTLKFKIKALIACLLWGSAFAGAKITFQYAGPIFVSGFRFTLAGILLLPVIWFSKRNIRNELKHWRFMLLFAFVQTFLQYGLFFMGLNKVPGATSAIIIGAGPLFVAIMAHLTLKNDKLTLKKIAAVTLGLAGVIFISLAKNDTNIGYPHFYAGVGILLLSNIIGSYTNIMVIKKKGNKMCPIVLTAFANFTGGIMLLITALIIEKPEIKIYPYQFYLAVIWLSLIPATAFSLWYGLLQSPGVKVSELNVWKFIIPVTGCILSWLLLADEKPNIYSLSGIVIILGALWLLQKFSDKK